MAILKLLAASPSDIISVQKVNLEEEPRAAEWSSGVVTQEGQEQRDSKIRTSTIIPFVF